MHSNLCVGLSGMCWVVEFVHFQKFIVISLQEHTKFAASIHRQLVSLQIQLHTHQQQHSETKRSKPLMSGLQQGFSVCFKAVEEFLQPDFKRRRCLRCNQPFETPKQTLPSLDTVVRTCPNLLCPDNVSACLATV